MLYIGSSKANSAFRVNNSIHISINYSINSSCYHCFSYNSPVLHCEIFHDQPRCIKIYYGNFFPFFILCSSPCFIFECFLIWHVRLHGCYIFVITFINIKYCTFIPFYVSYLQSCIILLALLPLLSFNLYLLEKSLLTFLFLAFTCTSKLDLS